MTWGFCYFRGQSARATAGVVSPRGRTTIGELPDAARGERRCDVFPWTDLPVCAFSDTDFHAAVHADDATQARATGCHCRQISETIEELDRQQSVPEPELHLAEVRSEEA
ncbi:hypothetical protein [Streptomyces sp. NPDC054849]